MTSIQTSVQRHLDDIHAAEDVRLAFYITAGFILGCGLIAGTLWCIEQLDRVLEEPLFEAAPESSATPAATPVISDQQKRRDETAYYSGLARSQVLWARRASLEELREMAQRKAQRDSQRGAA